MQLGFKQSSPFGRGKRACAPWNLATGIRLLSWSRQRQSRCGHGCLGMKSAFALRERTRVGAGRMWKVDAKALLTAGIYIVSRFS